MKKYFLLMAFTIFGMTIGKSQKNAELLEKTPDNFYDLEFVSLDGQPMSMKDYKGKYVLAVNVASKCGFTPQYGPLQELHEKYKNQLVVLGFPCNQFLGQEPGTEEEIATFCEKNYGVTFQLSEKLDVKGKEQHPVYTWLTSEEKNGVENTKVSWNFNKYLISPEGKYLAHFGSKVKPMDEEITKYFEK